jgi:hypothetical protein
MIYVDPNFKAGMGPLNSETIVPGET